MIIRRKLLQGLTAGVASASLSSNSALAALNDVMRRARNSTEYLEACIIASEESQTLNEAISPIDYWTFTLSNVSETGLPEGCRKVVILDNDISPGRIVRDIAKIHRLIREYYGFDTIPIVSLSMSTV